MAVPKRKMSRSRTRHRKAQWLKTAKPTTGTCPRCKATVRPHTACTTCGTYKGEQVIDAE